MLHWKYMNYAEDKMPELLRRVEVPLGVMYLWEYFLDMSARRTHNGYSYNPVTNQEVRAWEERKRIRLNPFENKIIDAIERVFLRIRNAPKAKS